MSLSQIEKGGERFMSVMISNLAPSITLTDSWAVVEGAVKLYQMKGSLPGKGLLPVVNNVIYFADVYTGKNWWNI